MAILVLEENMLPEEWHLREASDHGFERSDRSEANYSKVKEGQGGDLNFCQGSRQAQKDSAQSQTTQERDPAARSRKEKGRREGCRRGRGKGCCGESYRRRITEL